MEHLNVIDYCMKSIMHPSIKKAIQHSGYSDIELGQMLNVSRSTIFKWRTIEDYKIRSSNIVALAKVLGKEPEFEDGYVSFKNKSVIIKPETTIKDAENMKIKTEDLINDLRKDKDLLYRTLEQKEHEVKEGLKTINKLEKKLDSVKEVLNVPQIDHHSLQCVINLSTHSVHLISTAMANLFGYTPIEMLRSDFNLRNLVLDQDVLKLDGNNSVISPNIRDGKGNQYWALKTKSDKAVYVKFEIKPIGTELVFIDGKKITKKEYDNHIDNFDCCVGDLN